MASDYKQTVYICFDFASPFGLKSEDVISNKHQLLVRVDFGCGCLTEVPEHHRQSDDQKRVEC